MGHLNKMARGSRAFTVVAGGLALATLAGCAGPSPVKQTDGEITYRELAQVSNSCRPASGWIVARSYEEVEAAWTDLMCGRTDFDPPEFQTEMLFVYFMGEKPSGGFSAEIKDVEITGEDVRVTVVEHQPGSGCAVTLAMTRPAVAAAILKTTGNTEVTVRTETDKCK